MKAIFSSRAKRERPRERFYLLPGQSGRAYRRKQKLFLQCSIAVGLLVSLLFVLIVYLKSRIPG